MITRPRLPLLAVLIATATVAVHPLPAQPADAPGAVQFTVSEALGLRRFGYPVSAGVPLPGGALREASQAALYAGDSAMRGVQYDVRSRWPDGSIRRLQLSFNLSLGPLEKQDLTLRFGPGVSHPDPGRGVIEETPEAVLIRGVYRLPKTGPGFIDSVRYGGREFLRRPARWRVWRTRGNLLEELTLERDQARVAAPGPVNAVVELAGAFAGEGTRFPYRLTVAQPNSKSWFDAVLELADPRREVRAVTLEVPYVVEREPALYDFGVGSWVYGTLRGEQAARLEIRERAGWRILTGAGPEPGPGFFPPDVDARSIYAAASPLQRRAEGWGHLIDGAQEGRAVGFGSPDLAPGGAIRSGLIRVSARGDADITWWFDGRQPRRVRALYHHVADPVPVTAVTSPPSMLYPLRVTLAPARD
jgi:hypothetical protein